MCRGGVIEITAERLLFRLEAGSHVTIRVERAGSDLLRQAARVLRRIVLDEIGKERALEHSAPDAISQLRVATARR